MMISLFSIVGIAMMIGGVVYLIQYFEFKKDALETQAKITYYYEKIC